jgi:purine-binding chemotaxis protein CheW
MIDKTVNELNQYLTFLLDNETYAFNVLKIKEVLELPKITKMPKTPDFMAGVINLRGGVVPVIDLRIKFDMPEIERTIDTSIVIVEANYDDEIILIGALVDAVKAVIKISTDNTEPPPKVGMNLDTNLIDGIGKNNDNFVIILNVDRLFSQEELSFVRDISSKESGKKEKGSGKNDREDTEVNEKELETAGKKNS